MKEKTRATACGLISTVGIIVRVKLGLWPWWKLITGGWKLRLTVFTFQTRHVDILSYNRSSSYTVERVIFGSIIGKGSVCKRAGTYPSFYSMKRLGVFLLPPRCDACPGTGLPPAVNSTAFSFCTWVERGIVRIKCFVHQHNVHNVPGQGSKLDRSFRRRAL